MYSRCFMATSKLAALPQQCKGGIVRSGTKGGENTPQYKGEGVRHSVGGTPQCRGYTPMHQRGWPGRGNPTMNTPWLRRGEDSFFFKFIFTCSDTPIVCFVFDSASELDRWALTSFLGFSCPNLLFVFQTSFLGTCYTFFRECWDVLCVSFYLFFCTLFWVSLWPRKFVSLPWRVRKRRYRIAVRTLF